MEEQTTVYVRSDMVQELENPDGVHERVLWEASAKY